MKTVATAFLALFLLAVVPTLALAQMGRGGMGHGGGMMGGGGMGQSMGQGMGQGGMGSGMGSGMDQGSMGSGMGNGSMGQGMNGGQMPLSQSEMNSGAFRMLQQRTGLSADNLQQQYASSGARNFGQFASAMVVSKNLGLNSNQVLSGVRNQSLGQTLQNLGVSQGTAKSAIKQSQRELRQADKNGTQF